MFALAFDLEKPGPILICFAAQKAVLQKKCYGRLSIANRF